jgi:threonine dehydrogenase-like Zn-dependent dehydrogenase
VVVAVVKAAVYHGPGDVRVERVPDPVLREPTDAIVRVLRAAICGSDLWFYRGIVQWTPGDRTGHEFVGVVEEVGAEVRTVRPGDVVIAPFVASDGTCSFCRAGLQTSCVNVSFWGDDANGGQAEAVRVPWADGTLVPLPAGAADDAALLAHATALCDVMPTGHHGALTAGARNAEVVAVVGDGAVGLCAVHSAARLLGARRVIAIGHNPQRLELARAFGATETYDSHDPEIAERIVAETSGGVPAVVEAVGSQQSMDLAIRIARPGGAVTFVGVPNAVDRPDLRELFRKNVSLRGAVAPARAYIEDLLAHVLEGRIEPARVFDLELPLDRIGEGYAAMDGRRTIKVLLHTG